MALLDLFKPQIAGLLEVYEIDQPAAENTQTTRLKLHGTKEGFGAWLAKKLGSNQDFAISMTDTSIIVKEGKIQSIFPTSEVLSFTVGYGKDKKTFGSSYPWAMYVYCTRLAPVLFVYKKSDALTLEFNFPMHQYARTLLKNKRVGSTIRLDESVALGAIDKVREIVYNNSRYYQKVNMVNPSDI